MSSALDHRAAEQLDQQLGPELEHEEPDRVAFVGLPSALLVELLPLAVLEAVLGQAFFHRRKKGAYGQ